MSENKLYFTDGTSLDVEAVARAVVNQMKEAGEIGGNNSADAGASEGQNWTTERITGALSAYLASHPELITSNGCAWNREWRWAAYDWEAAIARGSKTKKLDGSGKEITGTYSNWFTYSEFIPVKPGEHFYINGFISHIGCFIYDADQKFLIRLNSTVLGANVQEFDIPEGGYYMRIQTERNGDYPTAAQVFRKGYGAYAEAKTLSYRKVVPLLNDDEESMKGFRNYIGINPYADKYFGIIGDSFTAPGTWVKDMCNNLGARGYHSEAVSGGAFSDYEKVPKTAYEQALNFVSGGYPVDVFVITLGTNDSGNKRPLGKFVESADVNDFDLTTFYGGMQACFLTLMENFPNAMLFVGPTPNTMQAAGEATEEGDVFDKGGSTYLSAIMDCCLRYGIKFIDTRVCGYSRYVPNQAHYFAGPGNGHPSGDGQHRIGRYMTRIMLAEGGWVDEKTS